MSKKRKASDKPSIGSLRTKGKNSEQQRIAQSSYKSDGFAGKQFLIILKANENLLRAGSLPVKKTVIG